MTGQILSSLIELATPVAIAPIFINAFIEANRYRLF